VTIQLAFLLMLTDEDEFNDDDDGEDGKNEIFALGASSPTWHHQTERKKRATGTVALLGVLQSI
jgi:hypothetical protein